MGKRIQITNTVGVGLVAALSSFVVLSSLIFTAGKLLTNVEGILMLIWAIISVVYCVFLIRSFSKTNLDNSYFNWAFYLNLVVVILFLLTFFGGLIYLSSIQGSPNALGAIDDAGKIMDIMGIIEACLFVVSFIVFMIGYSRNKKGLSS